MKGFKCEFRMSLIYILSASQLLLWRRIRKSQIQYWQMLILGQQSFRWIDVDDHGREYHHPRTSWEMDGILKITISLWGGLENLQKVGCTIGKCSSWTTILLVNRWGWPRPRISSFKALLRNGRYTQNYHILMGRTEKPSKNQIQHWQMLILGQESFQCTAVDRCGWPWQRISSSKDLWRNGFTKLHHAEFPLGGPNRHPIWLLHWRHKMVDGAELSISCQQLAFLAWRCLYENFS